MISIILPVYNAEGFLEECISSIIRQTYTDFELIIINDGSEDSSKKICEELNDKRVRLINQKNHGVGFSRNLGIKSARGDMLVFVDADDLLTHKSLSLRINNIEDNDLLISSYTVIDEQGKEINRMPKCQNYRWDKEEGIKKLFEGSEIGYQGYLWNKTFRTEIIKKNHILFEENLIYNEDRLFVLQYLLHCRHIALSDNVVYKYRKNSASAMALFNQGFSDSNHDKIMTDFYAYNLMKKLLKSEHKDAFCSCCYEAFCHSQNCLMLAKDNSPRIISSLLKESTNSISSIIELEKLSFWVKTRYLYRSIIMRLKIFLRVRIARRRKEQR